MYANLLENNLSLYIVVLHKKYQFGESSITNIENTTP